MSGRPPPSENGGTRLVDIDLLPTRALVELINDGDALVAPAVRTAAEALAASVDAIAGRLASGGRLVYVGAGSSGRLALVDAAECGPTFGVPTGSVVALVAGGTSADAAAQEAAEDDAAAGVADVARVGVGEADAVVAISASGRTPYTVAAARAARAAAALVVAVVCADDTELAALAHVAIVVPVGAEVVDGSTRMKAGTVQKLVLNTISTATMVQLGRTYGNLMVDVVASNAKLRTRARDVIALAADVSKDDADAALAAAGGDAKVAVVSLLLGTDAAEARRRLVSAGGRVRSAVSG